MRYKWLLSTIIQAILAALGAADEPDADLNGDGRVDALDIQLLINIALALPV